MCKLIDQRIYASYKLWPTNYIAADMLKASFDNDDKYTKEEREKFEKIMTQRIENMIGNQTELKRIYLEIYANPIIANRQVSHQKLEQVVR